MKKFIYMLVAGLLSSLTINAVDPIFTEYFDSHTADGNLEGTNGWYVSRKQAESFGASPKISATQLSYPNYVGSAKGKSVVITKAIPEGLYPSSNALDTLVGEYSGSYEYATAKLRCSNGKDSTIQRLSTLAIPNLKYNGKIYVGFLVKFTTSTNGSSRDLLTFENAGSTSSSTRGRVCVKYTGSPKTLSFGIKKNQSPAVESSGWNVNDTHLIVMVYEHVDGDKNDETYIYVNPDLTKTEALNAKVKSTDQTDDDYGPAFSVALNIALKGCDGNIGGIVVADSWEALKAASTGISANKVENKGTVISKKYYTLTGIEILQAKNSGIYIEKTVYESGVVETKKVYIAE